MPRPRCSARKRWLDDLVIVGAVLLGAVTVAILGLSFWSLVLGVVVGFAVPFVARRIVVPARRGVGEPGPAAAAGAAARRGALRVADPVGVVITRRWVMRATPAAATVGGNDEERVRRAARCARGRRPPWHHDPV